MRTIKTLLTAGCVGLLTLTGCGYEQFPGQGVTAEYRDFVPGWAESVATGEGSVSYVATNAGTVYLIDYSRFDKVKKDDAKDQRYAPRVISSYMLRKGQGISVDGAAQTITVGSTGNTSPTVFMNPNLSADTSYELRIDYAKMD